MRKSSPPSTEEYEKRLRNLLPGLDLHFDWKRTQGEKPKVNCNCWRLELDCEHEEDVKETLSLETPWLDALSAALESAEPEKVDLRECTPHEAAQGIHGMVENGGRENTRAAGS